MTESKIAVRESARSATAAIKLPENRTQIDAAGFCGLAPLIEALLHARLRVQKIGDQEQRHARTIRVTHRVQLELHRSVGMRAFLSRRIGGPKERRRGRVAQYR